MKIILMDNEYEVNTAKKIYNAETKSSRLELSFNDNDEVMDAIIEAFDNKEEDVPFDIEIKRTSKSSKTYSCMSIDYCSEDVFDDVITVTVVFNLA